MAGIASDEIEEKWISTITIDDLPYKIRNGYHYETAVFGNGVGNFGKVLHTERTNTAEEALDVHDRIVTEIRLGVFVPNGENWKSLRK